MAVNLNIPYKVTMDIDGTVKVRSLAPQEYYLGPADKTLYGYLRKNIVDAFAVSDEGTSNIPALMVDLSGTKADFAGALGSEMVVAIDSAQYMSAIAPGGGVTALSANTAVENLEMYLSGWAKEKMVESLAGNGYSFAFEASEPESIAIVDLEDDCDAGANSMYDGIDRLVPEVRAVIARQIPDSRWLAAKNDLNENGEIAATKLPLIAGDTITFQFMIHQTYAISEQTASLDLMPAPSVTDLTPGASLGINPLRGHFSVAVRTVNVVLVVPDASRNPAVSVFAHGAPTAVADPIASTGYQTALTAAHNANIALESAKTLDANMKRTFHDLQTAIVEFNKTNTSQIDVLTNAPTSTEGILGINKDMLIAGTASASAFVITKQGLFFDAITEYTDEMGVETIETRTSDLSTTKATAASAKATLLSSYATNGGDVTTFNRDTAKQLWIEEMIEAHEEAAVSGAAKAWRQMIAEERSWELNINKLLVNHDDVNTYVTTVGTDTDAIEAAAAVVPAIVAKVVPQIADNALVAARDIKTDATLTTELVSAEATSYNETAKDAAPQVFAAGSAAALAKAALSDARVIKTDATLTSELNAAKSTLTSAISGAALTNYYFAPTVVNKDALDAAVVTANADDVSARNTASSALVAAVGATATAYIANGSAGNLAAMNTAIGLLSNISLQAAANTLVTAYDAAAAAEPPVPSAITAASSALVAAVGATATAYIANGSAGNLAAMNTAIGLLSNISLQAAANTLVAAYNAAPSAAAVAALPGKVTAYVTASDAVDTRNILILAAIDAVLAAAVATASSALVAAVGVTATNYIANSTVAKKALMQAVIDALAAEPKAAANTLVVNYDNAVTANNALTDNATDLSNAEDAITTRNVLIVACVDAPLAAATSALSAACVEAGGAGTAGDAALLALVLRAASIAAAAALAADAEPAVRAAAQKKAEDDTNAAINALQAVRTTFIRTACAGAKTHADSAEAAIHANYTLGDKRLLWQVLEDIRTVVRDNTDRGSGAIPGNLLAETLTELLVRCGDGGVLADSAEEKWLAAVAAHTAASDAWVAARIVANDSSASFDAAYLAFQTAASYMAASPRTIVAGEDVSHQLTPITKGPYTKSVDAALEIDSTFGVWPAAGPTRFPVPAEVAAPV